MQLTRIQINNFRSIKSMDLAFPESGFLVLVGAQRREVKCHTGDKQYSRS